MKFIYIINIEETNQYKIGITKNIKQRIKETQTYQSKKVIQIFLHPTKFNELLERTIHRQFYNYKQEGEWFEFDHITLQNVIKSIKQLEQDFEYLDEHKI